MRLWRRKREPLPEWLTTVALYSCPAYLPDGEETTVSGLYEVVECHAVEPSAYVWTACVDLIPVGTPGDDWEDRVVTVDRDVFDSQVYPRRYGESVCWEREMELAQLAEYERDGR